MKTRSMLPLVALLILTSSPRLFAADAAKVARRAQLKQETAALEQQRDQLEEELRQEMLRLYRFLGYEDQIRGMNILRGAANAGDAPAQMAERSRALFRQSYSDADLARLQEEWKRAASDFFGHVQKQIDTSVRWPADRTIAEYRELAKSELAKMTAISFRWPDDEAAKLGRVNEVLAWTTGQSALPATQNYFSTSGERVLKALVTARIQTDMDLVRRASPAALPPRVAQSVNSPAAVPATLPPSPPPGGNASYESALALLQAGQCAAAEAQFRQLARSAPQIAVYPIGLGQALGCQGKWTEAIVAFTEAVRLEPRTERHRVELGNAWLQLNQPARTEAVYRDGLRELPGSALYYFGLGGALRQQNKFAEALTAHGEAVRLEPNNAAYHFWLATDYGQLGKWPEAESAARKAAQLDPKVAANHDFLGNCLFNQGRLADAEGNYRTAIRLDGRNGFYYANLAGALLQQGRTAEARQAAQTARQLGCTSHWALDRLP